MNLSAQTGDQVGVLRIGGQQFRAGGHLEVGEVEAGGDGAAEQAVVAGRRCSEEPAGRGDGLWQQALDRVAAQEDRGMLALWGEKF